MKLNELECLKRYNSESELIEILEMIGDKIRFRVYSQEEVLNMTNELVKINLISLNYEAREQILNTLCDAVSFYEIRSKIALNNILMVKDKLEDDLKKYVEELT